MNIQQFATAALLCLSGGLAAVTAAEERSLRLPDGTPLTVTVHPAAGQGALLWLPAASSDAPAAERRLAEELVAQGLEVWRPELLEARLLAPLESSLDQVPVEDALALIEAVHAASKKPVIVLAAARAGLLALRAAARSSAHASAAAGRRDEREARAALRGLVLLHPNLFLGPPEPGTDAVYHPAVTQVSLPVFLIQPALSPWRWRLEETVRALARSSGVYVQFLPGVRDRFYFRPDATVLEDIEARRLARHIARAARLLLRTRAATSSRALPAEVPQRAATHLSPSGSLGRRGLHPYPGQPALPPTPLRLPDLEGRLHALDRYRGQVVLVNFWATWCPPCVHELPSMQRLQEKMAGRPFAILAVNMGEEEAAIRAFLEEKASVGFPVLLDRDAAALKAWKVFVFPTSFLLGRDGRIRYAVLGALEWDDAEALEVIEALLAP